MNRRHQAALLAGVFTLVLTSGCSIVNGLRAKDNLNEGVRAYNSGKYDVAQQKFERALSLNPDNENARLFLARTLLSRFDQGQEEQVGLDALEAYDNIITRSASNTEALDQAYAFKAKIYDDLAKASEGDKAGEYKEQWRQTLLQRADLTTSTAQVKADVYYTLGVAYWEEAYALDSSWVTRNLPVPPDVGEKVRPLAQKAHEYLQRALSVKPDYANAYFYEKLAYLQDSYTDPNPARRKEFQAKALQAQDRYMELSKQQAQAQGEQGAQK